eukprot:gene23485-biopygen2836
MHPGQPQRAGGLEYTPQGGYRPARRREVLGETTLPASGPGPVRAFFLSLQGGLNSRWNPPPLVENRVPTLKLAAEDMRTPGADLGTPPLHRVPLAPPPLTDVEGEWGLPGHPARCTLPRAGLRAKTPGGAGWTSVARETQCPW